LIPEPTDHGEFAGDLRVEGHRVVVAAFAALSQRAFRV
jgi:hypothetical protein